MSREDAKRLQLAIQLVVYIGSLVLIAVYSNWQTALGVFLFTGANNMGETIRASNRGATRE